MDSTYIHVGDLRLHARIWGEGPPVLLLHGWPTSSFLWRNVAPHLAKRHRVVALDLPGFGLSDKPLDRSYSYPFFDSILTGATAALDMETLGLVVHDLGGPVGMHWALQNQARLTRVALLNTLLYPDPFDFAVAAFLVAARIPGLSHLLASQWGLKKAIEMGTVTPQDLDEAVRGVQEPFVTGPARKALIKSVLSLHPGGMRLIAERLETLSVPVRVIYGTEDRILPKVARTFARLRREVPHAEVTSLPCGHFLQEDRPDEVGALLAAFFEREVPSTTSTAAG